VLNCATIVYGFTASLLETQRKEFVGLSLPPFPIVNSHAKMTSFNCDPVVLIRAVIIFNGAGTLLTI